MQNLEFFKSHFFNSFIIVMAVHLFGFFVCFVMKISQSVARYKHEAGEIETAGGKSPWIFMSSGSLHPGVPEVLSDISDPSFHHFLMA